MARIGRYELLRPLGRGGMAEVFLARRRGPGGVEKQLAVKRIRRERTGDPRFVEMFVTEARLSMGLAHKNIVQVFDFGRVGDELFLVMEYVAGVDLGTALAGVRTGGDPAGSSSDGALDPLLAAFVGMEACQALDYAHRWRSPDGEPGGIVHRDVTPGNVLLSVSGEVKLADFGVADDLAADVGGRRLRGTPAYMSPEQARGERLDGRADVFSLGLVLWQALTGRRAYPQRDPVQILEAAGCCRNPASGRVGSRQTARDRHPGDRGRSRPAVRRRPGHAAGAGPVRHRGSSGLRRRAAESSHRRVGQDAHDRGRRRRRGVRQPERRCRDVPRRWLCYRGRIAGHLHGRDDRRARARSRTRIRAPVRRRI